LTEMFYVGTHTHTVPFLWDVISKLPWYFHCTVGNTYV